MKDDNAKKSGIGLPPGTKIGKYEVVEKVGSGGQSIVYKCYDSLLDRYVAAKQVSSHLADNPGFVEQFRREARVLAKLGSEQQGIVTIHDLLEDPHGLFIVMEFVEGETLEQLLISRGRPLATKPTSQLLWRLAGAMSAVHTAGIVHRDLKPSNVIVNDELKPTITDFGVAASLSGQTSMLMGTTKYMAPELFGGGKVDGRTDMYSLGFIVYELLLGRERFNEIFVDITRDPRISPVRWMKWHGNESVSAPDLHVVNPAIPRPLSMIVAKMMAKAPDERYADMEALGRSIKKDLAGVELSEDAVVADAARPALATEAAVAPLDPLEAGPTLEELEESPTAALPKRTVSKKQLITVAIVIGAIILVAGIGFGVVLHYQKAEKDDLAKSLYKQGQDAYEAGDYTTAADLFRRVRDEFPETMRGARSTVRVPLARAQEALVAGDYTLGFNMEREARERIAQFERRYGEPVSGWARDREGEIEAISAQRQLQHSFYLFLERVTELADAGRLEDALASLKNETPPGLTEEQQEELRRLDMKIVGLQVGAQWTALIPNVEDAARYYRTDQANRLLANMEKLASSNQAKKYVAGETLREWQEWLRSYRAIVTEIEMVSSLEKRLGKARAQADMDVVVVMNLTRKLLAARQALEGRFTPDKNNGRINDLKADLLGGVQAEVEAAFDKGAEFLGMGMSRLSEGKTIEAKTGFAKARDKFAKCLVLTVGDHSSARAALGDLDDTERWLAQLAAANGLFVQSNWSGARDAYTLLLARHDYLWVKAKITACEFNILIGKAKAEMAAGNFDEALRLFDLAAEFDPSRYDAEIASFVNEIEQMVKRAAKIAEGTGLMDRKKWTDARTAFEEALGLSADDKEKAEVEDLLKEVQYRKYIVAGKAAEARGQYTGAQTMYENAQEKKQTAEVAKLLADIAAKIAAQEGG